MKCYASSAGLHLYSFPETSVKVKNLIDHKYICYTGMNDPLVESDESDKDDDFGQAFYAGAGQQVKYSQ